MGIKTSTTLPFPARRGRGRGDARIGAEVHDKVGFKAIEVDAEGRKELEGSVADAERL